MSILQKHIIFYLRFCSKVLKRCFLSSKRIAFCSIWFIKTPCIAANSISFSLCSSISILKHWILFLLKRTLLIHEKLKRMWFSSLIAIKHLLKLHLCLSSVSRCILFIQNHVSLQRTRFCHTKRKYGNAQIWIALGPILNIVRNVALPKCWAALYNDCRILDFSLLTVESIGYKNFRCVNDVRICCWTKV